MENKRASNFYN